MYGGWTQVAFESELDADIVAVDTADHRLMAVRGSKEFQIYSATCPHRGAHLGFGGIVDAADGAERRDVTCPFHGHRVRLGDGGNSRFQVPEYHSLQRAKGLYLLTDPDCDTGLGEVLTELEHGHHVVEALSTPVNVAAEYVIENAFDADHFAPVHAVTERPRFTVTDDPRAVLRVEGEFAMRVRNEWMIDQPPGKAAHTRFAARLFSPLVVVSELGPADEPNVVITTATPRQGGGCVARVTIAMPRQRRTGSPPTTTELSSLVHGTRLAFQQDIAVWEHLDATTTPRYTRGDDCVRAYREQCERFRR